MDESRCSPRHDPCERLVDTMQKTAEQDVRIVNTIDCVNSIKKDLKTIEKDGNTRHIENINQLNKINNRILVVVIASFLGAAIGDKLGPLVTTLVKVAGLIFPGADALAGP